MSDGARRKVRASAEDAVREYIDYSTENFRTVARIRCNEKLIFYYKNTKSNFSEEHFQYKAVKYLYICTLKMVSVDGCLSDV